MAMAVHQSNTDSIARCGMSRATPEATGCCHRATIHSVLPQRPPGQQANKQQSTNAPKKVAIFDGRGGAPVQYHAHCPIEEA
jgi:hypothetical protein